MSYLGSKRKEVAGRSRGKHALEERRVTSCFWVVGFFLNIFPKSVGGDVTCAISV